MHVIGMLQRIHKLLAGPTKVKHRAVSPRWPHLNFKDNQEEKKIKAVAQLF